MNESVEKIFSDFKLYKKVTKATIDKYKDKVGDDVVELWKKYGFGSTFRGYLKLINPDDIQELLQETYIMPFNDIPIFVTGMGDIIICNSRGTFSILDYRHQRIKVLWTQKRIMWDFFFNNYYIDKYWLWNPYFEAVEEYGELAYDECFGYEPILSLGGKESVNNLRKVKYEVHISLIGEIQGVLSC